MLRFGFQRGGCFCSEGLNRISSPKKMSSHYHLSLRISLLPRIRSSGRQKMTRLHKRANGPLTFYLLASFITFSWGVPQGHFQRRNWTPQAMLYLKGAQGRRFISEESQQKAMYDRLMQESSNQNVNPLTLSEAALVFLSSLQKMQNEEDEQKTPERPGYFADGLLNW